MQARRANLARKYYASRCVHAAVLMGSLSSLAGLAQAHTQLQMSVPAAGAVTDTATTEIRLQCHKKIEANISHVKVASRGGQAVAIAPAAADPNDKSAGVVRSAEPLRSGTYKVNWRVISVDTHKVKGSFTLQVRP
jgi:copper resistance protein C